MTKFIRYYCYTCGNESLAHPDFTNTDRCSKCGSFKYEIKDD